VLDDAKRHTHTGQGLTISTIHGDLLCVDDGWPDSCHQWCVVPAPAELPGDSAQAVALGKAVVDERVVAAGPLGEPPDRLMMTLSE
jgi:hypothetical protein